MQQIKHEFINLPGGNPGRVFVLCHGHNGAAVDREQDIDVQGGRHGGRVCEQYRRVLPHLHHAAVLLLHGLAQGGRVAHQPFRRG